MNFAVIPVLEKMASIYNLPKDRRRFDEYLKLLQNSEANDIELPIAGFNPFGNELTLKKLQELQVLDAEQVAQDELDRLTMRNELKDGFDIKVAINLVDDIGGSWSHKYATEYKSKFEISALVKRKICTPHFWVSEEFDEGLIRKRVREYALRTIFWLRKGPLTSLRDFVEQEVFVNEETLESFGINTTITDDVSQYFLKHADTDEYVRIFNFFLGDDASKTLGYPCYGMKRNEVESFLQSTASVNV